MTMPIIQSKKNEKGERRFFLLQLQDLPLLRYKFNYFYFRFVIVIFNVQISLLEILPDGKRKKRVKEDFLLQLPDLPLFEI